MDVVLAEGGKGDFSLGLRRSDSELAHGDIGRLELKMRLIPPGTLTAIDRALRLARVDLVEPVFSAPGGVIVIRFRRNPGPLIIAAALAAIILILLLSWRLVKEVGAVVGPGSFTTIALIGLAALFLIQTSKRAGRT